jgi:hypothetical protein
MPSEDARQNIARRCGHRRAERYLLLFSRNRENDAVPLGRHCVRPYLIQVENDTTDIRLGAVLRSSDLPYAIGMHRDVLGVVEADCVRQIQQDSVRIDRGIHLGLDRSTDCDFDP